MSLETMEMPCGNPQCIEGNIFRYISMTKKIYDGKCVACNGTGAMEIPLENFVPPSDKEGK